MFSNLKMFSKFSVYHLPVDDCICSCAVGYYFSKVVTVKPLFLIAMWSLTKFRWLVVKLGRLTRSLSHERDTLSVRLGTRLSRKCGRPWKVDECFGAHHLQLFTKVRQWYSTSLVFYLSYLNSSALDRWTWLFIPNPLPFPFAYDRHVQTCLSYHQGAPTYKACCYFLDYFRAFEQTMSAHCWRSPDTRAVDEKPDLFLNIE